MRQNSTAGLGEDVALDPSDAMRKVVLAFMLTYSGRPPEAAALFEKAIRLSSHRLSSHGR